MVFENDSVRVVRVHYGPHEKLPVHSHSKRPTVYVYLSDSPPVQFRHVEKPPFALTRPPQKMGAFRVSPGRLEVHEVENLGDSPSEFLRVELKQIPLGVPNLFHRGPAPEHAADRMAEEYVRPQLIIERIIVVGSRAADLHHPERPSLLIAFSRATLRDTLLLPGEVRWLAAGETSTIAGLPESPAHVLRIELRSD